MMMIFKEKESWGWMKVCFLFPYNLIPPLSFLKFYANLLGNETALRDLLPNPRILLYPPTTPVAATNHRPYRSGLLLPADFGILPCILHLKLDMAGSGPQRPACRTYSHHLRHHSNSILHRFRLGVLFASKSKVEERRNRGFG